MQSRLLESVIGSTSILLQANVPVMYRSVRKSISFLASTDRKPSASTILKFEVMTFGSLLSRDLVCVN